MRLLPHLYPTLKPWGFWGRVEQTPHLYSTPTTRDFGGRVEQILTASPGPVVENRRRLVTLSPRTRTGGTLL